MAYPYTSGGFTAAKTNKDPLPVGEDPNKWLMAEDWNPVRQAVIDLGDAILNNPFISFTPQGSTPASPAAGHLLLFIRSNGLSTPNTRTQVCVLQPGGSVAVIYEGDPS